MTCRYVTGTRIEVVNPDAPRGRVRFALFDFDGTLSLIREGWQGVMIPFFVEEIRRNSPLEPAESVECVVREFVEKLTGKQTIYQCFRLIEEIERRGGQARTALEYKHEYLRRLGERIQHRLDGLQSGAIRAESLLLPGSREFLSRLETSGIRTYLASGTDLVFVRAEAEALGVARFFGEHIYGALDRYQDFSKQMIIERILAENNLHGPELMVIGDGYVEIENGKDAGGLGIGVASDEANPGQIDSWKRNRLIDAGADMIIPDYSNAVELLKYVRIEL